MRVLVTGAAGYIGSHTAAATGFTALNLGTGVGRSVFEIIKACRASAGKGNGDA